MLFFSMFITNFPLRKCIFHKLVHFEKEMENAASAGLIFGAFPGKIQAAQ